MSEKPSRHRALAVYPYHRGFAFAVIESPLRWIESATRKVSPIDDGKFAVLIGRLIKKHRVSMVAVEDGSNRARGDRAKRRSSLVVRVARHMGLRSALVADRVVRQTLGVSLKATHYEVAMLLAEAFPELAAARPKKRRAWESESEQQKTFRAIGLAVSALAIVQAHGE